MWEWIMPRALAQGEGAGGPAGWLSDVFSKFQDISAPTWIILGVLCTLGAGLLIVFRDRTKWTPRLLAYAALSIALGFVLSYVRLWKMLQGGSITPGSMLPLMLFSYQFGLAPGIVVGVAYGFLQFIQDARMLNPWQVLLDYPIAFGMMGLAAMFRRGKGPWGLYGGIALASLGRFFASVLSGVVFFGEYAPAGTHPLLYSIAYNGSYMLPEMAICLLVAALAAPRLLKGIRR